MKVTFRDRLTGDQVTTTLHWWSTTPTVTVNGRRLTPDSESDRALARLTGQPSSHDLLSTAITLVRRAWPTPYSRPDDWNNDVLWAADYHEVMTGIAPVGSGRASAVLGIAHPDRSYAEAWLACASPMLQRIGQAWIDSRSRA